MENCGDILTEKEDIGEIKAFVSELRAKYQKELLYNLKEENIYSTSNDLDMTLPAKVSERGTRVYDSQQFQGTLVGQFMAEPHINEG